MTKYKFTFGLAFLIGIVLTTPALAQNTFTVIYRYQETDRLKDSFYFDILKLVQQLEEVHEYPGGLKGFTKVGNEGTSTCIFSVKDTSCALIFDLFGHASFVLPGDSAWIDFSVMPKVNKQFMLDSQFRSPWAHYFTYSGKNRFDYSLFDSLTYHYGPFAGPLAVGVGMRAADNPDTFFNKVTSLYASRMTYLDRYASRYHITGRVLQLAAAEIKAAYISNLTQPMANLTDSFALKNYPRA